MNAPFRFAARACLVTAASGAMCLQVAGLFAQDNDTPSSARPAATKIKQVQGISPDAAGSGGQPASEQETPLQKEIRKKFNKNGKEAPSFRLEDAPNTQPPVAAPASPQPAAQAGVAGKPMAPAAPAAKPNWFERTFHIGRGRKQAAPANQQPANQYAAPTPPPTVPYRYPSTTPAARPAVPNAYRAPIAATPPTATNAAPLAKPAPVVTGPAATAAPAQPQFREPAPLGPTTAPRILPGKELSGRVAPPTVRPARPRKDSQPLLDESKMDDDSESLDLDDDDDPKTVVQVPQALPSGTVDGPAESPYTGLKIAPNETEQQFASSRPKTAEADKTAVDEARSVGSAKDAADVAAKTADSADKPNPEVAAVAKSEKPANDDFDLNDDDEDNDDDELALPSKEPAKVASGKDEKVPEKNVPEKNVPEKLVEPAPFSGLKGICPVALKDNRKLVDAQPGIKSEFAGRTYTFSSVDAKKTFDENPRKYAPVGGGNDVVKQTSGAAGVAGTLEHAAWYRGRLYLFSTADSRHVFVETPSKFVVED